MNEYFTRKNLTIAAVVIWILLGTSMMIRGGIFVRNFFSQFTLLTDFFDLANKRMAKPWEHFEEDMQKDTEIFQKQSEEFHQYIEKSQREFQEAMNRHHVERPKKIDFEKLKKEIFTPEPKRTFDLN